jgi:DNA-binding NarL/FixJ family response regulator
MFQKVLIAEDMDFINSGIKAELNKLNIGQIDYIQYCDKALLKLKRAHLDGCPYDLLISDLSFEEDGKEQRLKGGEDLIQAVRKEFPDLKIVVFSIEDKTFTIQKLFNSFNIDAYVWKGRNGLRELKMALQKIYNSESKFISQHCALSISNNNIIEIGDHDLFLIACLSKGYSQEQISIELQEKNWTPSSISSIEKRLKFLREHFNANNPAHLVAISKDLGLV